MSAERKNWPIPGSKFPILREGTNLKELVKQEEEIKGHRFLKMMMFLNKAILDRIFREKEEKQMETASQAAEKQPEEHVVFAGKSSEKVTI